MGSGIYAANLPYSDWLALNVAQRGHQNMIESSGPVLSCMLVSGLFQPILAASLGITYAISRLLYASGYRGKSGPDGRFLGSAGSLLASITLYLLTVYNGAIASGAIRTLYSFFGY